MQMSRRYRRTIALCAMCLCLGVSQVGPALAVESDPAVIPILSDDEVWGYLPTSVKGGGGRLPIWARALAESLPRTTGAMLELDWQHREGSSLDPKLRGRIRWTVAHENHCEYIVAQSVADLKRAGLNEQEIHALESGNETLSATEAAAIAFARKLTVAADSMTDEEVKGIIDSYGEEKTVAIVLLVAYANFQDRLILALQLRDDGSAALPAQDVRFAQDQSALLAIAPAREPPSGGMPPDVPERIDDREWSAVDFDGLQLKMLTQRQRGGRIRVPTWEEVSEKIPAEKRPKNPVRIRWSLVCRGYQPELAARWSACMGLFAEESQQDRVFEESVFWVITRTIHCFY